MLQKLTITLIGCLIYFNLIAQPHAGIRAGASFSDYKFAQLNDGFTLTPGLVVTGYANFSLNEKLSVQPELQFVQRRFPTSLADEGEIVENTFYRTNYLEIPLLLKYTTTGTGVRTYFIGGASLGYLLSEGYNSDRFGNYRFDLSSRESRYLTEVFGTVGAGLIFKNYIIDLRYVHGLDNRSEVKDFQINYTGFQLSLGYRLL